MNDTTPMDSEGGRPLGPGATFAGHRIESEIGRGGMGVVYRAHHLALERDRALKLIAPALSADRAFRERFRREARVAAAIDHPNVIPGFDSGEEDGTLYLTMRLVEGVDLRRLVAREGPLVPDRAAEVIGGVAAALDAAHAQGLVHRDVKPANILVESVGGQERVFLTDFGISRIATAGTVRTSSGELLGSVDYVAPEQIEGKGGDHRVDVYALGAVLYFALTGKAPFPLESDLAKLYAHAHAPRPRPSQLIPGLSPALDDVVARAMAIGPSDRYPSAGSLAEDLDRVVAGGSAVTPLGSASEAPTGRLVRPRRRLWLTLIGVMGLVAAAAAAVLLLNGGGNGAKSPAGPSASSARSVATIKVGTDPVGLEAAKDVWVASRGAGAIETIDPARGRLSGQPITTGGEPVSVASGFGSLWAVDATTNAVVRLDPTAKAAPVKIAVGEQPADVAVDQRWVWVANQGANTISRIDPKANRVDATVHVGAGPDSVATGVGAVWVTNIDGGSVSRIDPKQARVIGKPIFVGQRPNDVAVGYGSVWVTDVFDGTLNRIDPASAELVGKPIAVGARPRGVKTGLGSVWVANGGDNSVSRIDPKTGTSVGTPVAVGANPADIAVGANAVWTADSDAATVTKIAP
ncbi:MAG: protein kinase domain-containing protein [Solirubrobacterales bacterium]